jgi:malonate-semialdehyde dehydrogenase (acetylating)/methylmalonate-semialdehyde dehydrogenase
MAASVIACVGAQTYEDVCQRFVAAARQTILGNPLDTPLDDESMLVGPVISAAARDRIEGLIQAGIDEGAKLLLDGRNAEVRGCEKGYYVGPTVFADVKPGMTVEKTEIFGPVVALIRFNTLEEAISAINQHEYGNGASIYTQSGYYARKFKMETLAGMIGINVGIPAPVAYLPFGGMKGSFSGDIKGQGKEVVDFFTERRVVTERYWPEKDA